MAGEGEGEKHGAQRQLAKPLNHVQNLPQPGGSNEGDRQATVRLGEKLPILCRKSRSAVGPVRLETSRQAAGIRPRRGPLETQNGRSADETARVPRVITFEDCFMATNRSRRLRKKLCVDEFQ